MTKKVFVIKVNHMQSIRIVKPASCLTLENRANFVNIGKKKSSNNARFLLLHYNHLKWIDHNLGEINMKTDRLARLKQLFIDKKQLSCNEICEQFGVSIETTRRDLAILEKEGVIKRVYGGGVLIDNTTLPNPMKPYASRTIFNSAEKNNIAREIIQHIEDNSTIALDSGTTILPIAKLLYLRRNLNIITNDIHVASEISAHTDHRIYMIGGLVRKDDLITGGFLSLDFMENFSHIDTAIMTADGFIDGLADFNVDMGALKKVMIRKAKKVFAVVDHTKFTTKALNKVCNLKDLDLVVTGKNAPVDSINALRKAGVEVILVNYQ